jgi:hypothetical protein
MWDFTNKDATKKALDDLFSTGGEFKVHVLIGDKRLVFESDSLTLDGDDVLILDDEPACDDDGNSYITDGTLNTHPGVLLEDDFGGSYVFDKRDLKLARIEKVAWEAEDPFFGYDMKYDGKKIKIGCQTLSQRQWKESHYVRSPGFRAEVLELGLPRFKELRPRLAEISADCEAALGIQKKRLRPKKKPVKKQARRRARTRRRTT